MLGTLLPYVQHVSQLMVVMFDEKEDEEFNGDKHKEEGEQRRKVDCGDRYKILTEFDHYPHPLKQSDSLVFNIVNGCVGTDKVNVHNSLSIGVKMVAQFVSILSEGFYGPLHMQVFMMETMKKGVKVCDSLVYDMDKLYGRLLVISQKRDITL